MVSGEELNPREAEVNAHAAAVTDAMADFYDLENLATDSAKVIIGYPVDGGLERVSDRTYSIMRTNGNYSLNHEDYNLFEDELEYTLSGPAGELRVEAAQIAQRIFVGIGVANVAIHEMLGKHPPSPLREQSHAEALRLFFTSTTDIRQGFNSIFYEPEVKDRAEMTTELKDATAMSINGLRFALRLLFDVPKAEELTGVEYGMLIYKSQKAIRALYERDAKHYVDVSVVGLGQNPKKGDTMFFNALPDWLVAAAVPMRPESFKHFFAKGWGQD